MAFTIQHDTLEVFLSQMPPNNNVLTVSVVVNEGGAAFQERRPGGINDKILYLELVPGNSVAGDPVIFRTQGKEYTDVRIVGVDTSKKPKIVH